MLSESQPEPHPEDLLRHYFAGDRQLCMSFVSSPRHKAIVEKIARKQTRGTSVSWEDACQTAYWKVLQALQAGKFRQGELEDFYRWAATVARFAIIDLVRRERHRDCTSLDRSIPGTDVPLVETIADPLDLLDAIERSDWMLRAVEAIAHLDQLYPERAYWQLWQGRVQGKHQTQLAAELGFTQSTISKRWKELIRRVTEILEPLDKPQAQTAKPLTDSSPDTPTPAMQDQPDLIQQQRRARSRSQSQW